MALIGKIDITMINMCAAENHFDLTVDLNNGERIETFKAEEVEDLIGSIMDDDVLSFLKILLKLGMRGRTKAAVVSLLQDGVIVTIDASPML